jgi:hypothetical protein
MQLVKNKVKSMTEMIKSVHLFDMQMIDGFYAPNADDELLQRDQILRVIRKVRLNIKLNKAETQFLKENLNMLRKFWSIGKSKYLHELNAALFSSRDSTDSSNTVFNNDQNSFHQSTNNCKNLRFDISGNENSEDTDLTNANLP